MTVDVSGVPAVPSQPTTADPVQPTAPTEGAGSASAATIPANASVDALQRACPPLYEAIKMSIAMTIRDSSNRSNARLKELRREAEARNSKR